MRRLLPILFVAMLPALLRAQVEAPNETDSLQAAALTQQKLYTFDVARPVDLFDATPNGSLWYAVDHFGLQKTITINGYHKLLSFDEIPQLSIGLSPNGKYLIWMGIQHQLDTEGFNVALTTVYRADAEATHSDSVGTFTSYYDQLFFSGSGDDWAALLPAANVKQQGLRDVAILDGKIVSSGYPNPSMFTFGPNIHSWAYRSRDGRDENVITPDGKHLLYKRTSANPSLPTNDPVIFRFSPDVRTSEYQLAGRDYDFNNHHTAVIYRTSYLLSARDTAKNYVVFRGKREFATRWIQNLQISPDGKHIVYFASDTARGSHIERALVVRDGVVIAGPYEGAQQLFLSPSGKHMAWTIRHGKTAELYVDGKFVRTVGTSIRIEWSPDERQYAYVTSSARDKVIVVAGRRRSPSFDFVGRLGVRRDGSVEYLAINYTKLLRIEQRR